MSERLKSKVAIITGAGQGIGLATAEAFAKESAAVVLAEINERTGAAAEAKLRASGARALFVATDVTRMGSVETMAARALSEFGQIDVLVANAGINVFSDPLQLTETEWRRCLAVDLDGVWFSVRAVLPQMLSQENGSIVVMASAHAHRIIPGCFPYPVAKHALLGLVRALGVEYAARGIRVNAIAPGYVDTEIARNYWASFPDPEAVRGRISRLHPPQRIGSAEEVAMTAVFLASDEARFINAATISIDGGRSAVYHD